MQKELYLRFTESVQPDTADRFFRIMDRLLAEQYGRLHLLMSSPGGMVSLGLSMFNFLRGAPFETWTYNFGSVDSIGVAVYCAGNKRFASPQARFFLHGVHLTFDAPVTFTETQLAEYLKSIRADQEQIAAVIAETTEKLPEDVLQDMRRQTTLNAKQAKEYGLIHEIKTDLIPPNAEVETLRIAVSRQPTADSSQMSAAPRFPLTTLH